MNFLQRMITRAITSAMIVAIIASGYYDITGSLYTLTQAVAIVFAIISADMLIERYFEGKNDEAS